MLHCFLSQNNKQQLCIKPIGFLVVFSTELNLWLVLLFKLYFNKSNSKMPSLWEKPTFSALHYIDSEWYEARIVSKDLQERFFTPERNKFVYSFIKFHCIGCVLRKKKRRHCNQNFQSNFFCIHSICYLDFYLFLFGNNSQ